MISPMKNRCICGNDLAFEDCCKKFIDTKEHAKTAVELMRSRYSAYVLKNGQYLYDTCSKKLQDINDIEAINHSKIEWIGLKVEEFSDYEVAFTAFYKDNGKIEAMKEHSYFIREEGCLKYDRGEMLLAKIERNDACPCQSGKKYKKCCG